MGFISAFKGLMFVAINPKCDGEKFFRAVKGFTILEISLEM
jgi:hypothetical protein